MNSEKREKYGLLKSIVVVCIAAMVLFCCFSMPFTLKAEENGDDYVPEWKEEWENNLNDLNSEKDELENELDNIQGSIGDVEQDIEDMENQIEEAEKVVALQQEEANLVIGQLESLKSDIDTFEKNLEEIEADCVAKEKAFLERAQTMYQYADYGMLDILLESKSLFDFFDRIDAYQKVLEEDKRLMKEVQTAREQLKIKKEQSKRSKSSSLLSTAPRRTQEQIPLQTKCFRISTGRRRF